MNDLSPEEISDQIDRAVRDLLEAAEVEGPSVDALWLARHHGIEIKPRRRQAESEEITEEPTPYTAAQAIGKHFLNDLLERLGVDPESGRGLPGASLVNLFADRLLLPTLWFRRQAGECGYDLETLQEVFPHVGLERLALRLLDLDEPCIITIIDNDHIARRRSNTWPVNRTLSAPERECQKQIHRYSRPARVARDGWTVQGWPVHRVDHKREILRSVVEGE